MFTHKDNELKHTPPPSCEVCGVPKKPVWALHKGDIKLAVKCKCGIALYHQTLYYKPPDELILEIIKNQEEKGPGAIDIEQIEDRAKDYGFGPKSVDDILDALVGKGRLQVVGAGRYSTKE